MEDNQQIVFELKLTVRFSNKINSLRIFPNTKTYFFIEMFVHKIFCESKIVRNGDGFGRKAVLKHGTAHNKKKNLREQTNLCIRRRRRRRAGGGQTAPR